MMKLLFLALALLAYVATAEDADGSTKSFAVTESEEQDSFGDQVPLDVLAGQENEIDSEELHERVKRSPWGGRRRRRWRFRGRRISSAVKRTVRNVGKVVKKIPTAVKKAVKKIPTAVRRTARKIGSAVRRTVRKASSVVRKTVQKIKKTVKKIKEIPRKTEKAIRRIRDKIKEKVGSLIKKKPIEVVGPEPVEPIEPIEPIEPVTDGPQVPVTVPAVVTKPSCDDECQTVKEFTKDADFFKQCYCAFYTLKRHHRDFFLDRNKNNTLDKFVTDVTTDSIELYISYAEALKTLKHQLKLQTQRQVMQYCLQTSKQNCPNPTAKDVPKFFQIKCLKPCSGFTGCTVEDKTLARFADDGIKVYNKKLNSVF